MDVPDPIRDQAAEPTPHLDGYQLLEPLGSGGMADVFLAKARSAIGFERLLVVKRMRPEMCHDLAYTKMFVDEANIAVTLTHSGIGRVYELGVDGDVYYIAMEYIPGVDLADIFWAVRDSSERMPLEHVCFIMSRVCDALGYAHEKRDGLGLPMGIVHRDVTPSNIIVGFQGEVKLIDFGIAKAMRRRAKTQTGVLKGKPRYLAPEQVRNERPDHRADIFSAGVVLYELLCNERMHSSSSDRSVLGRVRDLKAVPRPSTRAPDVPRRLDEIVARATAPDVRDRYQTAHQLHDDLHEFMCEANLRPSSRKLSRWMRKRFAMERAVHVARMQRYLSAGGRIAKGTGPTETIAARPDTAPLPPKTQTPLVLPLPAPTQTDRVPGLALPHDGDVTRISANRHVVERAAYARSPSTSARGKARRQPERMWSQYDEVDLVVQENTSSFARVVRGSHRRHRGLIERLYDRLGALFAAATNVRR